tara:strand:+ start:136192 stop:136503 length:312 start_codon:yes stop_codon:yes gene_type:complete
MRIFAGLLFLMFGCDCHRHAEGIVVDDDTKRPIAGVQIVNNSDFERGQAQNLFVTDSAGQFSYSDISGGIFGCPDLVLVFTKSDYLVQRINVSNSIDTVFFSK